MLAVEHNSKQNFHIINTLTQKFDDVNLFFLRPTHYYKHQRTYSITWVKNTKAKLSKYVTDNSHTWLMLLPYKQHVQLQKLYSSR